MSALAPGSIGREVLAGPKATGDDRYAVLRDPAGASFVHREKGA